MEKDLHCNAMKVLFKSIVIGLNVLFVSNEYRVWHKT